jgi:glycerol-3-phosphate dehydrogenase
MSVPDLPAADRAAGFDLKPASAELEPEVLRFVTELRQIFGQLGTTLGQYARFHHRDKTGLSRYLSGARIPPRAILDELVADITRTQGAPMTAEAENHLRQLHMDALACRDRRAYQVQVITDHLQNATTELRETKRRIKELEEELVQRETALNDLTAGTRQLRRAWDDERERTDDELRKAQGKYERVKEERDRLVREAAELRSMLVKARQREHETQERCLAFERALQAVDPDQDDDTAGSGPDAATAGQPADRADSTADRADLPEEPRGQGPAAGARPPRDERQEPGRRRGTGLRRGRPGGQPPDPPTASSGTEVVTAGARASHPAGPAAAGPAPAVSRRRAGQGFLAGLFPPGALARAPAGGAHIGGTGLDARDRGSILSRLATERFDVLVIGGGITGAGAALDASLRGLRVALVEARDLASGSSGRSSNLVDGGLRYLEQFDFKLVYSALRERDLLVSKLAPHLVKPVPFLYPLYKKVVERPYVATGLTLYDSMEGTRRPLPHHRHLTTRGALRRAPGLTPERLAGAMLYYDAQVDDARYTLTVARTAAVHKTVIATRVSAIRLHRDWHSSRVTGTRVRDEESGREFNVTADSVVVCAGVWSDLVHDWLGVRADFRIMMSKGVHIVVPRDAIVADTAITARTELGMLFFIPWGEQWIVGTTEAAFCGDRAEPVATEAEVDSLLTAANRVLARPLTRADIVAVYAGLRPLAAIGNAAKPIGMLSPEHVVDVPAPGLASVAGGRFTTYRLMARDVVDAAVTSLRHEVPQSVTDQVPLLGADGLTAVRAAARRTAEDYDISRAAVEHLLGRYGTLTVQVLEFIRADPRLARPLAEGHPYLRAEVAYAVTHENALHVDDVLMRRTRLFIESADSGAAAAADVSVIMGRLLGWSRRRRNAERRRYLALVESGQPADAEVARAPEKELAAAR